ncbi:MAG: hypothetical protein C0483_02420 [Pirellula sp.]|nr:hypothetical protein [Pirellula sp.]
MSVPISAPELLSRDFLEVRAKILELAACLDRFQRAAGSVEGDPRMRRIAEGLHLLQSADQPDRAEQVQLIFSLPYEEGWRGKWNV